MNIRLNIYILLDIRTSNIYMVSSVNVNQIIKLRFERSKMNHNYLIKHISSLYPALGTDPSFSKKNMC